MEYTKEKEAMKEDFMEGRKRKVGMYVCSKARISMKKKMKKQDTERNKFLHSLFSHLFLRNSRELKGTQGNSKELKRTQRNSRELKGTQGNSSKLI